LKKRDSKYQEKQKDKHGKWRPAGNQQNDLEKVKENPCQSPDYFYIEANDELKREAETLLSALAETFVKQNCIDRNQLAADVYELALDYPKKNLDFVVSIFQRVFERHKAPPTLAFKLM